MIVQWIKPLSAALFLFLVCLQPAASLEAASQALASWAQSVAPALLPFLIAAPALTGPEVSSLLGRISSGLLSALRLPARSTGALLIGLLSGSPAGAAALSAVSPTPDDPPGAYLRAAVLSSGASPSFLITGVAVSMLNAPETGPLLLRSQLLSALAACLILLPVGGPNPTGSSAARPVERGAVLSAALTLLTIAGYMAFFSVLARLLALFLHPALETPLAAVLELAGGCRALSALPAPLALRLPLISAASCFGGLSVFLQSMSFLSRVGVSPLEYASGKLIHSALAALLTHLQLALPPGSADPLLLCLLLLSVLLLGLMARTLLLWRQVRSRARPS